MDAIDFKDQYNHPNWQKKRLTIMQRDGWVCRLCSLPELTLHVHHRFYKRGVLLWNYEDICYLTLCDKCHSFLHKIKDLTDHGLSEIDPTHLECFAKSDLQEIAKILFDGEMEAVRKYASKLEYHV